MINAIIKFLKKLINRNERKVKVLINYDQLTEDEKRWLERKKLIEGIQF